MGHLPRREMPISQVVGGQGTTRRRSRLIGSPVLGLTSNRGKFELDTSSRIRWPGMNKLVG